MELFFAPLTLLDTFKNIRDNEKLKIAKKNTSNAGSFQNKDL